MKQLYLFLIGTIVCSMAVQAQSFEYIQNKGQWHSDVLYKGELTNGAFFLKKQGYRVLQHQPEELAAIKAAFTGHELNANSKQPTTAANQNGALEDVSGGGEVGSQPTMLLHSHAYDVTFVNANTKAQVQTQKQQARLLQLYFRQ
ncbi:hypothetical protein [Phnomibacter ginsenosidimutans]|uniref:DUF7948 domain-containing protein n=1 Tax=Phnomibacter ginsenosidimutans TaxID=2676868 RepID=A0A6I6G9D9_9BACT|nr:hypothetical protein [Phnomibacter ginsenosidimutans]QGW29227.1 hypothetical protein GLV81_14915 [Phnomibacter ginsenosidimutans]